MALRITKTVHVSQPCPQMHAIPSHSGTASEANWEAPSIEHDEIDSGVPVCGERHYPTHNRRPPDRFSFQLEDKLQLRGASVTDLLN